MNDNFSDILLHIPHSSDNLPMEFFQNQSPWSPGYKKLREKSHDLIDWYTDELFVPDEPHPHIHTAIAPLCRTLCDVERLQDDPLEKRHLGILFGSKHVRTFQFELIPESESIFRQYYAVWHVRNAGLLASLPSPLLIDCHSFSNRSTPLCRMNQQSRAIDICIGYNDDDTRPSDDTIQTIRDFFESKSYNVGVNTPFSNAKTFASYRTYKALMIEVNKRVYMNEYTMEKTEGFWKLREDLNEMYMKLIPGFKHETVVRAFLSCLKTAISGGPAQFFSTETAFLWRNFQRRI